MNYPTTYEISTTWTMVPEDFPLRRSYKRLVGRGGCQSHPHQLRAHKRRVMQQERRSFKKLLQEFRTLSFEGMGPEDVAKEIGRLMHKHEQPHGPAVILVAQ